MQRTLAATVLSIAALAAAACTTPAKTAAAPAGSAAHAVDCASASLSLPDETVVGKLDGKPITVKDLGPEASSAERKALYEYCDAVSSTRNQALDNYVTEQLVEKAGKAAGKTGDEWMQAEVQKRIPQPADAEIKAFYEARKRPGMPALETMQGDELANLRSQIVMVMGREKSEEAVRGILSDLKKGIAVERALPDVRSPARDIKLSAHTATKGGKGAKVQIVEFADFQCPYCSRAADAVHQVNQKYGDKVEIAYRNFPLKSIHPFAQHAAEVAQCAMAQGKFWEMSDKMYADQEKLDEASLKDSAKAVGLDMAKFDECLSSGRGAAEVDEDLKVATDLGLEGTPTFFVNGRQHLGAPTLEGLSTAIDAELK